MNERFRLFVYGQLRRGQIGHRLLGLEHRTRWLGPARIHGRLYDLRGYPGLILGGERLVYGELLGFDDPALWARLDKYEDCDLRHPTVSEYARLEVGTIGNARHAWTYVYTRPIKDRPVLASGRWISRPRPVQP